MSAAQCFWCDREEPESGYDENGGEWMEAPSGRVYCPKCFAILFEQDGAVGFSSEGGDA